MTSLAWVEAKLHYFRTIRIGLSGRTEGAKLMTLQSQIKAKRVNELFSSAAGILPMSQVHMNISPNGPSGCGLPFIFASFTPFPTKIACINVNVHVINTITQNAQTEQNQPSGPCGGHLRAPRRSDRVRPRRNTCSPGQFSSSEKRNLLESGSPRRSTKL